MKCEIYQNEISKHGFATMIFRRHQTTLVFKQVPAQLFENRGKKHIPPDVNQSLSALAEQEFQRGVTIEMLDYAV